jgi:hypothetical protein
VEEFYPIATGFILGFLFSSRKHWFRALWLRLALIIFFGVSATLISGEFRESWGFVLNDIGEVSLLAWAGYLTARVLEQRLKISPAKLT